MPSEARFYCGIFLAQIFKTLNEDEIFVLSFINKLISIHYRLTPEMLRFLDMCSWNIEKRWLFIFRRHRSLKWLHTSAYTGVYAYVLRV